MDWLWATAAIVGGFAVGTAASKIARRQFETRRQALAQLAPAAASLTFSLVFVVGLLVALGFVQPDSLTKLRDDTIDYLPRALSAIIVVILGSVLGTIVSTAVRESIGRSMGRLGQQLPTAIKGIVTTFSVILAASQLGIDTTVINIVVASAVFALGLAFALVVGLGSRPVATEIASGRALRRLLAVGDTVTNAALSGTVTAMHPTAVEIESDGHTLLIPNSELADSSFQIMRRY